MKTENTLENKAKFFAQYLGQKILNGKFTLPSSRKISKFDYIKLTPLSQITDEDDLWIAKQSAYRVDDKNVKEISEAMLIHLFDFNEWSGNTVIYIYQYLQSKGYALPYMGLSVEELVSYGWVKLKENYQ